MGGEVEVSASQTGGTTVSLAVPLDRHLSGGAA
jgi:hypothetical protein